MRDRLRKWKEERAYGTTRAGRWSREQAQQRRAQCVRTNWKFFSIQAVIGLAVTSAAWLIPAQIRELSIGAWLACLFWALFYQVVLLSGSATADIGAIAEGWTASDLQPLSKRGWTVFSHCVLKTSGDIDHLAIGPAGAIVFETKWRSTEYAFGRSLEELDRRPLERHMRYIRLMLQDRLKDTPVRGVFVLWGPVAKSRDGWDFQATDVVVLPGRELRKWLLALPESGLSAANVASAAQTIREQIDKRDARDQERAGTSPRALLSYCWDLVAGCMAAVAGFLLASVALQASVLAYALLIAGSVALAVVGRRVRRARLIALVWLIAILGLGALVLASGGR